MSKSKEAKYRVGVIGCGRKGTEYARAYHLHPLTEVVAATDSDPENLELFCRRFNLEKGYNNYREMLRREKIDIASVILPVKPNPEVVLDCARTGVRAIGCEKPIAASLAEADRMVEVCRDRGVKFACGDLERNFPQYWKAKEIIDSGELGAVQGITFTQGSGTQMSGGGCQIFSLIRLFASDAEVAWVTGWVADDPMSDYDQGVAGYIRFANGIEAFIHRQNNAKRGFEVLCSRGMFFSDGAFPHMWKAKEGVEMPMWSNLEKMEGLFSATQALHEGFGKMDEEGWEYGGPRQHATIQSMVDALEMDIEPRSNGDNGRKVLEMAIALRESHRRGHVPVQLPLVDRSSRIIPLPGRWLNKKEVYGREWYAKQIGRYNKQKLGKP